jgi:predicted enzyme related to lactoylglutathione lyase
MSAFPIRKEPAVPKRDEAPIGAPCWIEVFTSDPDKSRAFYGELFGWTSEETGEEYGGYINFRKDGIYVAGCMRNDGQAGMPDVWTIYLATDNAAKTEEAAVANGGQVIVPAMEIGQVGSMAVVVDPAGAAIGAWQPGLHKGFGVLAEPGTPSWFELLTPNYDESVEFYRQVFKWDTHAASDTPELRYTTLGEGESQAAGIMDGSAFLPDGVPAQWSIYFGVEDAKIVELGGAVVRPAEDTPYGRLAEAADPTGAHFKLIQPPTS